MSNKLDKYQKLSQLEHILQLPDTYIGSIEKTTEEQYILISDEKIEKKEITYVPGLFKIFDEILVNAIDHHVRCDKSAEYENVNYIKVTIDEKENVISVRNEGGIEIDEHPTIKDNKGKSIRIPELIFGHLLTSSNYDKNEQKIVGGKNGYGAKLANIFSTEFKITTINNGKKYVQEFRNNMNEKDKPSITTCKTKPYTEISFKPDLKRFGMEKLDKDIINLMSRRVIDTTACTEKYLSVELNGKKLVSKTLAKYVNYYIEDKEVFTLKPNNYWEFSISSSNYNKLEQISFVNGVATSKGGKHVDYISNQIVKKLTPLIEKKTKKTIKPNNIKDNLFIFLRATIVNPSFDSQTKEYLTTNQSKFGSTCDIDSKFIDKLFKSHIVKNIIELNELREAMKTKKTDGKKKNTIRGIPKLDDANKAGTSESSKCTLILTEGDSAKAFVMGGIKDKDYYGVFPLKGKLINVRNETTKAASNTEIINLKKILGLQEFETGTNKPKVYNSTKELRYGQIRLCMDQDVDGSHIKGLIMNFLFYKWPSLMNIDNFVVSLITPIVKATKKVGKTVKSFYTLTDYENWKKKVNMKDWHIKYYKGLGTNTSKESKEYFSKLDENTTNYNLTEECKKNLQLAFDKKLTNDRKTWLNGYNKETIIERNEKNVSVSDFINKDLIHFSNYDNERSIPSMIDGFKPSQRKILFAALKKNLTNEIKVAQFSGYVSEHSAYHHGEMSLQGAIINMAQNFVGSNNINLLEPIGQFGTRLQGGKDHASPRYIFTKLNELTNILFNKDDNYLLNYLDDDGMKIEPEYYLPILPTILINGTEGIGTGWSTKLPSFDPMEILKSIRNLINNKAIQNIKPWYRYFKGEIITPEWNGKDFNDIDKIYSVGNYEIKKNKVIITELPIGIWTDSYKEYLETIINDSSNKKNYIESYKSKSTDIDVYFEITFKQDILNKLVENKDLETILKLKESKNVNISNIHLYDLENKIKKYSNVKDIITDFYKIRLDYYNKRYNYLLEKYKYDLLIINARIKFVMGIIDDELDIFKKEDDVVMKMLEEFGLPKISKINYENIDEDKNYDYLLNMPMRSMTKSKLDELNKLKDDKEEILNSLKCKFPKDLWLEDLKEFEKKYKIFLKKEL